jgi:hypothetical protein
MLTHGVNWVAAHGTEGKSPPCPSAGGRGPSSAWTKRCWSCPSQRPSPTGETGLVMPANVLDAGADTGVKLLRNTRSGVSATD